MEGLVPARNWGGGWCICVEARSSRRAPNRALTAAGWTIFLEKYSTLIFASRVEIGDIAGNLARTGGSMSGPPPTPLHLRLLRGNPSKRPLRAEPEPAQPATCPTRRHL